MEPFVYEALSSRVVFGRGRISEARDELEKLGAKRALVLSTPEQEKDAQALASSLGPLAGGVFSQAAMHTPVDVTNQAMVVVSDKSIDAVVSIGGGSTIGLGKAIALRTDMPQLAIPTTYAGSEMTPIIGQTEDGVKTTQTTLKVLPETVIYDPELTYTLPSFIAGPSAMNAIAHSVEALYAQDRNPIVSMLAQASIEALATAVPNLMSDTLDSEARANAQYGAWLAGACLASVGMAIHHKICHTLGGTFDLNHGAVHCLMIPYTAAYNRDHASEAMKQTASALGVDDAPGGLYDLMLLSNKQKSLRDFGLTESDLDRAATLAVKNPYYNPRPVEKDAIRSMLQDAFEGVRPM
ncbi:maleylacetate reductase [Pseudahrensia aquimaris]|uniref:Maleylacetate reductase n=1 Tax=Pseudahrensia aquimaris TaxID=744461 RepID=A0ABW3FCH5_9HYPH